MSYIASQCVAMSKQPTDIGEHLPTLAGHAAMCTHITECGVRGAISSYAFASGLVGRPECKLVQVDPERSPGLDEFHRNCEREGVPFVYYEMSDLECPMEKTELLFIDTWHIYGQLKRELNRWNTYATRYIILHDTEIDKWRGETIRCGFDAESQSRTYGIPVAEINRGLWPAVLEFLEEHPEWTIREKYTNCNGLTVLARNH
jgi:hypothetical protein